MTKLQSWMMTGLAIAALGIGALLATGALTSAQEGTQTPTPTPTEESTDDAQDSEDTEDSDDAESGEEEESDEDGEERRGCGGGGKYLIKEAAAEVLGLSEEELREALRDGQSLAEIAEAQGMSVEDFSAALSQNVTSYLQEELAEGEITQEEFDEITAELSENLDDIINSEGGFRFHHRFDDDDEDEESEGTGAGFRGPFQRTPAGNVS